MTEMNSFTLVMLQLPTESAGCDTPRTRAKNVDVMFTNIFVSYTSNSSLPDFVVRFVPFNLICIL